MNASWKGFVAVALGLGAGLAQAGGINWSIGISLPPVTTVISNDHHGSYYQPAPVYHAPPPVVYRPAPIYYAPPPVVYRPVPIVAAPTYIVERGYAPHHRHWREHRRHEQRGQRWHGHDRHDDHGHGRRNWDHPVGGRHGR